MQARNIERSECGESCKCNGEEILDEWSCDVVLLLLCRIASLYMPL